MKVVKPIGQDRAKGMDATVPVPLSIERQAEKGMDLAQLVAERDALVDQKKAHAKADQELIDQVDERISSIAKQIREGMEDKLQRDLKFEDTQALARVAERVGEVPPKAPAPSEPHEYARPKKGEECTVCGAGPLDPVHDVATKLPARGQDGAYAFSGEEPRDPVIRTHAAVDPALTTSAAAAGRTGGNGGAAPSELLDGETTKDVGDPARRRVPRKKGGGKAARS